jgi:teichuronic acid exporter
MERGASKGISFVISIILARLLLPDDFGLLVITMIFISIANIFVQTGFNISLIQKKDADYIDFSSIFYISLALSVVLYGCIYLAAPLIASFFGKPELNHILKILALSLPFGAYNSIQSAFVIRQLKFKLIFYCNICATIFSGIAGILMAYKGYGLWALVVQQLCSIFLTCLIMQILVRWRPRLVFSISRVKLLVSYGWKITVSAIIDAIYLDIFSLIIGKFYSTASLAYYNRGENIPKLIAQSVNTSIGSVMLPVYSKLQDDKAVIKRTVRRAITSGSFIFFPMMIGLAAVAEPFIIVLLTEKWAPSIPFLQIFCLAFLLYPINIANTQAYNGIGRSDIFLKNNIMKKLIGIIILLFTVNYGIKAIAIGYAVSSLANFVINIIPNQKLLDYGLKEQCRDVFPTFILSLFMGILVYSVNIFNLDYLLKLCIQVIVGVLVYTLGAYILKLESFNYLLSSMLSFVNRYRSGDEDNSV